MTYWINGTYREKADSVIALADRGFALGDGLFETLLVRGGEPVFLSEHLARLKKSADFMAIPVAHDETAIHKAIRKLADGAEGDLAARITLSRGVGPRGILPPKSAVAKPVMTIALSPAPPARRASVSCILSSIRRNEGSPAARMKTLSYIDNILARQEAEQAGAGEAIMLNNQGLVTCASVGNIFIVTGENRLLTPNTDCGVLPGIVRRKIIDLARENGIEAETGYVQDNDYQGRPIFITNSLTGMAPAHILGEPPSGRVEVIARLKSLYAAAVAADLKQRKGG
ncbi:aminotransferase class IV [Aquisalinus flavus]|uniref:Probable branched-chain-amino-acid aminotransferase n=1 Tax=Aquisalinus flavus TaxID=1526572 RepID=A0A8J2Y847_9PROT|nr:aminotransferase class IV [Aquisalinus flavus]MBD0425740.1 aminotransferase class IV [Aquisalinus flavus]UNE48651.1 hypothetical protein FF099_11625 [Aquisalinus flavus]GGD13637.1 4-amino-4-deoxychorismate lyase [Aquisalinus flavus]